MPDFEENTRKEKTQQNYQPRETKGSGEKSSSPRGLASSAGTQSDKSTNLRGRWKSSTKKAPRTEEEPRRPQPISEKEPSMSKPKRPKEGERSRENTRAQKSRERRPGSQQKLSVKDKEEKVPSRTRPKGAGSSQKKRHSSPRPKAPPKKSAFSRLLHSLGKLLGIIPSSKKSRPSAKHGRGNPSSHRSGGRPHNRSRNAPSRSRSGGHSNKRRSSSSRSSHSKSSTGNRDE